MSVHPPTLPEPEPASASAGSVRRASLVGALLATASLARFSDPAWAVDDAWISFRTARNLVEHGVLTFDAARPPVEGVTNLAWTLASAVWVWLLPSVDPIAPARVLGAVLHLVAVLGACALAARLAGRAGGSPAGAAAVTAALLGTSGTLAFHALSGLETALYGAAFALPVLALAGAGRPGYGVGRDVGAGVLLGLLGATRPEGVLLAGLLLAALAVAPSTRGAALRAALPCAAIVGGVELFRLIAFGALVPNTLAAKPPDPLEGARYVGGALLFGGLGAGAALALPLARRDAHARALLVVLGLFVAAVAASGGDWMSGARRLAPALYAVGALAGAGAALGGARARSTALVAVWLAGTAAGAATGWDRLRQAPLRARALAEAAAATDGIDDVALADIGVFGWWFPGSLFDLVGLTDAHIASLPGRHGEKEWDEDYFRARAPDLVLVRSETPVVDPLPTQPVVGATERPVLHSILDRGGYRYHGTFDLDRDLGRYVLVFVRDGLTLPPSLWGPPASKDLRQLLKEHAAAGR